MLIVFLNTVDCRGNAGFLKLDEGLFTVFALTKPRTLLVGIFETLVAMLLPGSMFSLPGAMFVTGFSDLNDLSI